MKKAAASIKPATESKIVAKKPVKKSMSIAASNAPRRKSKIAASKRPTPKSEVVTLKSKVFTYLDQNPQAKLMDLRKHFPDVNNNYLSVILGRWKKAQPFATKNEKPTKAPIKVQKDKTAKGTSEERVSVDHLAALQKTITAQENTIEVMHKTIDRFDKKERLKADFKELASMTIDEIKKVAAVFIRRLKDLPSKFKSQ